MFADRDEIADAAAGGVGTPETGVEVLPREASVRCIVGKLKADLEIGAVPALDWGIVVEAFDIMVCEPRGLDGPTVGVVKFALLAGYDTVELADALGEGGPGGEVEILLPFPARGVGGDAEVGGEVDRDSPLEPNHEETVGLQFREAVPARAPTDEDPVAEGAVMEALEPTKSPDNVDGGGPGNELTGTTTLDIAGDGRRRLVVILDVVFSAGIVNLVLTEPLGTEEAVCVLDTLGPEPT